MATKRRRLNELSATVQGAVLAGVVAAVLVVLAIAAEGAVRVRQWIKYGYITRIEDTYRYDAESGLRLLLPNTTVGGISINSLGFRGPEIAVPKPAGTIRLAFVGASTTYCAEVTGNAQTWPHLVTSKIAAADTGVTFDYVNAGVPGYDAATSMLHLNHEVAPLDPDVIVIYHATNDLSQNTADLAKLRGVAEQRTEETLSWISEYSLLTYLIEKNLMIMAQQARATDERKKLGFENDEITPRFKSDLTALVRASQQKADLVAVATFSFRLRRDQTPEEQSAAAVTSLYYMPYMSIESLLRAADAYNAAIREVAAETGALLIEVADEIPGDATHFVDSVHFTDRGSAAIADLVTADLLASEAFSALVATNVGSP